MIRRAAALSMLTKAFIAPRTICVARSDHRPQRLGDRERREFVHRPRPLGDAHRQVGDPLQVGVDLQHRGDPPQIDRHRLVQGQHLQALFLDVDLVLVDILVRLHDLVGQLVPPLAQGQRRLVDHLLDHRRDAQQLGVQVLQVAVQVFAHNGSRASAWSAAAVNHRPNCLPSQQLAACEWGRHSCLP